MVRPFFESESYFLLGPVGTLPVVWANPAQPPSVSRCAPRSRSPVSLIVLQDPACAGGDPVLLPPLVWRARFIYLFIYCASVFVCRPSLLEITALFIYLFRFRC
mgnify:CR=1 FL=1